MIASRVSCVKVGGFSSHEEVIAMVTYDVLFTIIIVILNVISLCYAIFSNKR